MPRILWKPDSIYGQCKRCKTVYDFNDDYTDDYFVANSGQFYLENLIRPFKCTHCGVDRVFFYAPVDPASVISKKDCPHCDTPIAPRDRHCNECGAPL